VPFQTAFQKYKIGRVLTPEDLVASIIKTEAANDARVWENSHCSGKKAPAFILF
jgi:hypothetical protein